MGAIQRIVSHIEQELTRPMAQWLSALSAGRATLSGTQAYVRMHRSSLGWKSALYRILGQVSRK